jgi:hypothetical protein
MRLLFDILPPGYIRKTRCDAQGQLGREVDCDQTVFFPSIWLRYLIFSLISCIAQAMGGEYAKRTALSASGLTC